MKSSALLLVILAGCGNAAVVAPQSLAILDTHPGNGSVIAAGEQPIVVSFSEDVVTDLLEPSILLEETTPQGTPIRELAITLDSYDRETFSAVFRTEEFPAGTTYALTIRSTSLRATSGARLPSDLIRRFQTR